MPVAVSDPLAGTPALSQATPPVLVMVVVAGQTLQDAEEVAAALNRDGVAYVCEVDRLSQLFGAEVRGDLHEQRARDLTSEDPQATPAGADGELAFQQVRRTQLRRPDLRPMIVVLRESRLPTKARIRELATTFGCPVVTAWAGEWPSSASAARAARHVADVRLAGVPRSRAELSAVATRLSILAAMRPAMPN